MAALETAMKGDDYLAIRHAVEALDIATKPFAQVRMNRAIEAGFLGKTLDEAEATVAHAHGLDAAHEEAVRRAERADAGKHEGSR